MSLLPGEEVVSASNVLTLTNMRIRYDAHGGGQSEYISITLDAVASCGLVTRAHPLLLAVAAAVVLVSLLAGETQVTLVAVVVAALLVVAYFSTRSAVIKISSQGGENIVVPTSGMSRKEILEFLDCVDEEKLQMLGADRVGKAA